MQITQTDIANAKKAILRLSRGDEAAAEDAVSMALVSLSRSEIKSNPGGLLFAASRNAFINILRRASTRSEVLATDTGDFEVASWDGLFVDEQTALDLSVEAEGYRLLKDDVEFILDQLGAQQAKALRLYLFEMADHKEIADSLGCSYNTAKAHVYQGLKKIKGAL